MRLVLASRNQHKVSELAELLSPHELLPLPDEVELPPETGDTFTENALIKARAAAKATGVTAIADDSGIVVEALGGAPGVRSARYAGEAATDQQNLDKLLRELGTAEDRRAAYVCVLALVDPDGGGGQAGEETVEARCEGKIALTPRGAGGFGYDPAFIPDQYADRDLTMAEISQSEKDAISHRGKAARELRAMLG